jgi:hypothetical protein
LPKKISPYWNARGYDVFYDHDPSSQNVGKIVSTLNKDYKNGDELSQLDIVIVKQGPDQEVAFLIEIEETTSKPKTFLGDIFGVLFGEHIFFKRNELIVGATTILVVVAVNKPDHPVRNDFIQAQVNQVKAHLSTRNARIGKLVIKSYSGEEELMAQLPSLLDKTHNGKL